MSPKSVELYAVYDSGNGEIWCSHTSSAHCAEEAEAINSENYKDSYGFFGEAKVAKYMLVEE